MLSATAGTRGDGVALRSRARAGAEPTFSWNRICVAPSWIVSPSRRPCLDTAAR